VPRRSIAERRYLAEAALDTLQVGNLAGYGIDVGLGQGLDLGAGVIGIRIAQFANLVAGKTERPGTQNKIETA
jgi:hypothetical protein